MGAATDQLSVKIHDRGESADFAGIKNAGRQSSITATQYNSGDEDRRKDSIGQ